MNIGPREGDRALPAACVHPPLHAQGLVNVARDFNDGRMDQDLRARLIELFDDGFQGPHLRRVRHDDQRVLADVGRHHRFALAHSSRRAAQRGSVLHALPDSGQHLGQLFGIAVAQTNHPRIFLLDGGGFIQ